MSASHFAAAEVYIVSESNMKLGVKIDPAKFDFKPPEGVDVFEDK